MLPTSKRKQSSSIKKKTTSLATGKSTQPTVHTQEINPNDQETKQAKKPLKKKIKVKVRSPSLIEETQKADQSAEQVQVSENVVAKKKKASQEKTKAEQVSVSDPEATKVGVKKKKKTKAISKDDAVAISSSLPDSGYSLGDLSALFSPHLEKDVFSPALVVEPPAPLPSPSAPLVLGKNARKKLRRKGLPLIATPPVEEKSAEAKAEEGILVNPEKIQQSLVRQREFAKGANHHEDDERLPRTIFVGNIPVKMKIKAIIKEFKQYGEVESARFRSFGQGDPKLSKRAAFATKTFHEDRDSCNAYIVFKDEEAAHKALGHNNKTLEGYVLRVDMAGGSKKGDKNRSIFVGNLPFTAKENELRDFFADSGVVENVRIVRDKVTGIGKGFAFVLFQDVPSARKALAHDQSTFAERPLRVFKAVDKPKPLKKTGQKSKPTGSAGKPRVASRKSKEGESWQGETAHAVSSASKTKKRKHALRGKGFVKKNADGEVKPTTQKGNSSKKFRKENDKKFAKKPTSG